MFSAVPDGYFLSVIPAQAGIQKNQDNEMVLNKIINRK